MRRTCLAALFFVTAFCIFTFGNLFLGRATSNTNGPPALTPAGSVIFDFDGDGMADVGRWHPATHEFKIQNSSGNNSYSTTVSLGNSSSRPVAGDFNWDNKTDVAVFTPGATDTWSYILSPLPAGSATPQTITLGVAGSSEDIPVYGIFDSYGEGPSVGVFRPSTGNWYLKQGNGSTIGPIHFGPSGNLSGSLPVTGDFDGDGKTDLAIYRLEIPEGQTEYHSHWYIHRSSGGDTDFWWGQAGDIPVEGDFNGDGTSDPTVYRPSDGTWYVATLSGNEPNPYASVGWGNYADQPVPADYDGDGFTDYAVWRPTNGVWYIKSSNPENSGGSGCGGGGILGELGILCWHETLGSAGDTALPSVYTKQVGGTVTPSTIAAARLTPKNETGGTNLYSQNFSWGTSLVSLPGRAGLNAGFGISYNSLVWLKSDSTMYFDPDVSNVTPGFRFGFPVIEPVYYSGGWCYIMVSPDGGRTEFRQIAASNTYETGDSSYTQLVTTGASSPNAPVENITITVTTTDGTQMNYVWKGGAFRCSKILDRNGNFITVNHDEQGVLRSVTDTLGRVINIDYDGELYPILIWQSWKNNNGQGGGMTPQHKWAEFTYDTVQVNTDWDSVITAVAGPPNGTNLRVLKRITYADQSYTQFLYNSYAQVTQVENHAADGHELNHVRTDLDSVSGSQSDCPRFTQTDSYAENFNGGNPVRVENTAPQSSSFEASSIYEDTKVVNVKTDGHPDDLYTRLHYATSNNGAWRDGLPIATEDCLGYDPDQCSNRQRWSWTNWEQDVAVAWKGCHVSNYSFLRNPRVIETQVGDSANTKRTTTSYYQEEAACLPTDPAQIPPTVTYLGLVAETAVYGTDLYTVKKRAVTEYNLDTAYLSRRIIGLPSETRLYDENETLMSKMTYGYDEENFSYEPNQNITSVIKHDNENYSSNFVIGRGNLTTTTRHDVTGQTSPVTSTIRYDIAGSPVAQIDPLNRKVSINYSDVFNDTTVTRNTYAYPTTVTDPANNSSSIKYRFDFGANVWARSPKPHGDTSVQFGKTTSRTYNSTTGRIEKEKIENTGLQAYTRYSYALTGTALTTYSTIIHEGSGNPGTGDEVPTETIFDGAGRVIKTRTENPGSTGGPYIGKLVEYNILGQLKRETVPTEMNSAWETAGDDYRNGVFLWNWKFYDWKGRIIRTRPSDSDGTTDDKDTIITYEGCGCAGGQKTTIMGPETDAIDVGGTTPITGRKTQKIREDILGRTVATEIWSLNGGSLYSTTVNQYNGRDQVTDIIQYAGAEGSGTFQTTSMTYDGHGRPSTLHKPEYAASTFTTTTYNVDDTVATVTDPRGATTTYTYETVGGYLKRPLVTAIAYSAPSPIAIPSPVSFVYDAAGNRTSMSDGTGTLEYMYDELSRLKMETKEFQDLPQNEYTLSYEYHLTGGLKSITEPFGHKTIYSSDKIGRLTMIGKGGPAIPDDVDAYMSDIKHRAFGAVREMKMKTTAETTISMTYDEALRPLAYDATNSANGATHVQQAGYTYNNDGTVKEIDNVRDGNFDQKNVYDFAGRLKKNDVGAIDLNGNGSSFKQAMTYDAFSNLTSRNNSTYQTYPSEFSAAYSNNRKTSGGSADTYDMAGNVVHSTSPEMPGGGPPYTDIKNWNFDAAGHLAHWDETGPWGNETHHEDFIHDGDGRATKKVVSQTVPWYYIFSTVTGEKITDVVVGGGDGGSRVYMGSTLIHDTSSDGISYTAMGFKVTDPISGSTQELSPGGAIPSQTSNPQARNEMAGLGTSVPTTDPQSYPLQPSRGGFVGDAEGGCTIDGLMYGRQMCNDALANGIAVQCPNNDCNPSTRWVQDENGKWHGILTTPVMARGDHDPHTYAPAWVASFDEQDEFLDAQAEAVANGTTESPLETSTMNFLQTKDKKKSGKKGNKSKTPSLQVRRNASGFDFDRFILLIRLMGNLSRVKGICADALTALNLSSGKIIDAFQNAKFEPDPSKPVNRASTSYARGKGSGKGSTVRTLNGMADFVASTGTSWLFHEMAHAASKMGDQGVYLAIKKENINIPLVTKTETVKGKSKTVPDYSMTVSDFFNTNCR